MLSRVGPGGDPDSYQLTIPALTEHGLIVGRNTDSDIVLNTDVLPLLISKQHAKLSVVGHTLLLQDAGSTNGTYVNEGRLTPNVPKELLNGNVISFGGPKLIIRDNEQLDNPFVYSVSGVESVTGQAPARQDHTNAATQPADIPAHDVAVSAAADTSAAPFAEQSVDLTRASSSEASIVDLTGSPDINAGQKRTKPTNEPAAVAAVEPQAPSSDGGAKKALENEFECTICRDFMVATHSVVPCGHMFCGECLCEWLQKNPTCPKCRAAATAPPVRTMAVDNVLESLVEKGMSKEDLQERKQRRQHWEAHAGVINSRMKNLFQHNGLRAPHAPPFRGYPLMDREALAAMQQGRIDSFVQLTQVPVKLGTAAS
ncbi:hypothetical protein ABBQ38_001928 [Trebouxia sp. C0009 RCD-2024]